MADREPEREVVAAELALEVAIPCRLLRLERERLVVEGDVARLVAQKVERTVLRHDRQPSRGLVGHAPEWPGRHSMQQRVLHGILGEGDATGPQPPRQGGARAARRIASQRINEPVNWPVNWPVDGSAQSAALTCSAVMVSTGRSSIQLVPFHRCGHSLAMASASATSLASIVK